MKKQLLTLLAIVASTIACRPERPAPQPATHELHVVALDVSEAALLDQRCDEVHAALDRALAQMEGEALHWIVLQNGGVDRGGEPRLLVDEVFDGAAGSTFEAPERETVRRKAFVSKVSVLCQTNIETTSISPIVKLVRHANALVEARCRDIEQGDAQCRSGLTLASDLKEHKGDSKMEARLAAAQAWMQEPTGDKVELPAVAPLGKRRGNFYVCGTADTGDNHGMSVEAVRMAWGPFLSGTAGAEPLFEPFCRRDDSGRLPANELKALRRTTRGQ